MNIAAIMGSGVFFFYALISLIGIATASCTHVYLHSILDQKVFFKVFSLR